MIVDTFIFRFRQSKKKKKKDSFTSENDSTTFQQEIQNHSPIDTVSHPK
jgi:hypothetical protein